MAVIHKQKLTDEELQRIKLPYGARILTVRRQHSDWCLWYLVPDAASYAIATAVTYEVAIRGTGHLLPEGLWEYWGTMFSDAEGTYVFHVFGRAPIYD